MRRGPAWRRRHGSVVRVSLPNLVQRRINLISHQGVLTLALDHPRNSVIYRPTNGASKARIVFEEPRSGSEDLAIRALADVP